MIQNLFSHLNDYEWNNPFTRLTERVGEQFHMINYLIALIAALQDLSRYDLLQGFSKIKWISFKLQVDQYCSSEESYNQFNAILTFVCVLVGPASFWKES